MKPSAAWRVRRSPAVVGRALAAWGVFYGCLAVFSVLAISGFGYAVAAWCVVLGLCGAVAHSIVLLNSQLLGGRVMLVVAAAWLASLLLVGLVTPLFNWLIFPSATSALRQVARSVAYSAVPLLAATALVTAFARRART